MKQHEVGHRALANPAAATAPATSAASAKPSKPSKGNSVPKSNHIAGRSNNHPTSTHHHHQPPPTNLNHKTVTVTDLANSCSTALATEIAIQQVKQSRSYQQQFMPDSSDSDSDDVLSVSSFLKGIGLLFFSQLTNLGNNSPVPVESYQSKCPPGLVPSCVGQPYINISASVQMLIVFAMLRFS